MRHKTSNVPRLVSIQIKKNDNGLSTIYRHPYDEEPSITEFNEYVDEFANQIKHKFNLNYDLNHCLIQLYINGNDYISEHSDKTLDINLESDIINFSIDESRIMKLKHKSNSSLNQSFILPHNSVLIMNLDTNQDYLHMIKRNKCDSLLERISFTFRSINTFINYDKPIDYYLFFELSG